MHILKNEDILITNKKHYVVVGVYPYSNEEVEEDRIYLLSQKFECLSGENKVNFNYHIEKTNKGKPEFVDIPDRHLSISHSGKFWTCAISDIPVGIDIQKHEDCMKEKIAENWFHQYEKDYLKKYGYNNFFDIWTAKESFVKYTGQGIDENFSSFYTADRCGRKTWIKGKQNQGYLLRPFINSKYSVCICVSDYIAVAHLYFYEYSTYL